MQKLCKQCSTMSDTDGNFCPTCGASYGAPSEPSMPPPVLTSTSGGTGPFKSNVNPTFVWLTVAVGVVGVISTFLTYADDGIFTFNGWDSRDLLDQAGESNSGPLLICLFSIAAIVGGLVHVTDLGKKQTPQSQGIASIAIGGLTLWQALSTRSGWNALFDMLQEDSDQELFLKLGIGLNLGIGVGIALMVIGLICLTNPSFHTRQS